MVSSSGTRGAESTKVRHAPDRQWAEGRVRYMAAPCDFPGRAVSTDP
jgi:hypothetical protein